jgi:hypothetical protein
VERHRVSRHPRHGRGELLLSDTVERQIGEARQEHEERTARREEDDFDEDVADYVPTAHTDPVEAMLDSAGLKRWAVEANHFELPEAASLVVEAGSWAGAASLATKALGTPARMDSIECLAPSEGTVPSIVAVSVRK